MILCFGSINPDLIHEVATYPSLGDDVPAERFAVTYGGGAANVAVCLAAWEAEVFLSGHTLGEDPLANWLVADLEARTVKTSLIERRPDSETPHTIVIVTPDGERTIIGSSYKGVDWSVPSDEILSSAQAVVVDGYSGDAGSRVAANAGQLNVPVIGLDVDPEVAASCRLVVWSRHERALPDDGTLPTLIVTDGPRPLVVIDGVQRWVLTPPAVKTKSAVGAGDAFGAMCALGVANGWKLPETVRRAAAVGALVAASDRGDQPPSLEAVEQLTKSY